MKRNYLNTLFITILCLSCYVTHAQQWNEIATIDGETPGAELSKNVLSKNGSHLIVGAPSDSQVGSSSGAVRVYQLVGGDWVQKGQEILGIGVHSALGENIAISESGNRIIMGDLLTAINGQPAASRINIYDFNGTIWELVGNSITGQAFSETVNMSVDITPDGSKIAIGIRSENNKNGALMVFELQGDTWTQVGQDIKGGNQTTYPFNELVSNVKINSDGTRILAGDPAFNDSTGQVRTYELQGDTWVESGMPIVGDKVGDFFGYTLDTNDDLTQMVISSTNADPNSVDSGLVKTYEFNGSDWVQKGQTLFGDDPEDFFGEFAIINESGDIIAVPSSEDVTDNGQNSGSVKVFKLINNSWIQEGETLIGEMEEDFFGSGVSMNSSGDTLFVGVPGKDINGQENVGQIKVFKSDNVLSIDDTAINTIFKVYPNPSITNFDIDLTTIHKEVKVTIIDVVGGKVFNNKYQNTSKIKVAHNLASGLYLVNITAQNTEKQFKLLVK